MFLSRLVAIGLQVLPANQTTDASLRLHESAAAVLAFPNTTVTGYPVSGRTLRTVRASLKDGQPTDPAGGRYHGLTTWRFQPRLMRRNGECDPQSADVEYSIIVTLPDLETRDRLGRAEREQWDRYFAALVAHELNHVRIVQKGAELAKAAMQGATGCEAIQAAARSVMDGVSVASMEYDRRTRHGATEGALL